MAIMVIGPATEGSQILSSPSRVPTVILGRAGLERISCNAAAKYPPWARSQGGWALARRLAAASNPAPATVQKKISGVVGCELLSSRFIAPKSNLRTRALASQNCRQSSAESDGV